MPRMMRLFDVVAGRFAVAASVLLVANLLHATVDPERHRVQNPTIMLVMAFVAGALFASATGMRRRAWTEQQMRDFIREKDEADAESNGKH